MYYMLLISAESSWSEFENLCRSTKKTSKLFKPVLWDHCVIQ